MKNLKLWLLIVISLLFCTDSQSQSFSNSLTIEYSQYKSETKEKAIAKGKYICYIAKFVMSNSSNELQVVFTYIQNAFEFDSISKDRIYYDGEDFLIVLVDDGISEYFEEHTIKPFLCNSMFKKVNSKSDLEVRLYPDSKGFITYQQSVVLLTFNHKEFTKMSFEDISMLESRLHPN